MPRHSRAAENPQPLETVAPAKPEKRKKLAGVTSRRRTFNTDDSPAGQEHTRRMKSTGPAREALEPRQIDPVDGPVDKDKLEKMKFDNDILEIEIHESQDPNANPIPEIIVNGRREAFFRGQPKKVKRMFVEQLLRMKSTRYDNKRCIDPDTGIEEYQYPEHTSLVYPFTILHDPAGEKGRDWAKKIKAEA